MLAYMSARTLRSPATEFNYGRRRIRRNGPTTLSDSTSVDDGSTGECGRRTGCLGSSSPVTTCTLATATEIRPGWFNRYPQSETEPGLSF